MIPAEFAKALQSYYGQKYGEVDRPIVYAWIKRFHEGGGDLDALFEQVTTDVSKNFGKLPDKALLTQSASKLPEPVKYKQISASAERLSDEEREEVARQLGEIMKLVRRGKPAPERRDPYVDRE